MTEALAAPPTPLALQGIRWLPTHAGCAMATGRYDPAHAPAEGDIPASLSTAHPSRRAEFHAGRHLVALCARRLGIAPFDLPRGPEGPPLWPDGLSGSISHSRGLLAVALTDHRGLLGLDIERLATERKCRAIWQVVLTPPERLWLSQCPEADLPRLLTTIFSAKESFYKTAWPLVRRKFGFDAACLLPFHVTDTRIRLEADPAIATGCTRLSWTARVWQGDDHVLTSITEQDTDSDPRP